MKKLFMFLIVLAIFAASCMTRNGPAIQNVLPTATAYVPPTSCTVWSVTTWEKLSIALDGSFRQFPLCPQADINSGCGVGGHYNIIDKPVIDWIKKLNINSPKTWNNWAAELPSGDPWLNREAEIPPVSRDVSVKWNPVSPAARDDNTPSYVCVSEEKNGFVKLVGVPYQPNGNYARFDDRNSAHPFLVWPLWANYSPIHKPFLYWAISIDGCSIAAYHPSWVSKGGCEMWLEKRYLDKKFETFDMRWMYTNGSDNPTPTITSTPIFNPTITPTIAPDNPTPTVTPASHNEIVVYISASPWLSMRPDASMSNLPTGNYYIGSKVFITQIFTDKNGNVFGQTRNGDWLALLLRGRYYTTWRLGN